MVKKTQAKDSLDVFSWHFWISLCWRTGRPRRHAESFLVKCLGFKDFSLFHSSPQHNERGWCPPSFHVWGFFFCQNVIFHKQKSLWESSEISPRLPHISPLQLNLLYIPLNAQAMKEKNTISYTVRSRFKAAEMWNPRALNSLMWPQELGVKQQLWFTPSWCLKVGRQGELTVNKTQ